MSTYRLPHELSEFTRLQIEHVLEYLATDDIIGEEQDLWDEVDTYLRMEGFQLASRSLDSLVIRRLPLPDNVFKMSKYRRRATQSTVNKLYPARVYKMQIGKSK